MSKATEQSLSDLHFLTAEVLKAQLSNMRESGEADPKLLGVVIKFLKDNNIECTSDEMKNLMGLEGVTLPSFEELPIEIKD